MPNDTTVWLLTRAKIFGFSQASVTVAISDSVTRRPPPSGISSASRSAIFLAPPSVRIAWSRPAKSALPPVMSILAARSARLTSAAVAPSAFSRSGSSSTLISRVTPP